MNWAKRKAIMSYEIDRFRIINNKNVNSIMFISIISFSLSSREEAGFTCDYGGCYGNFAINQPFVIVCISNKSS
jgi:hypothetical protein